jgi:glutamyl-tRNA(Gln) amidotransferase subunit D
MSNDISNGYSKKIQKVLKDKEIVYGCGINVGDDEGILMPKSCGDCDCLVLKLKSGYNIGVRYDKQEVKKLSEPVKMIKPKKMEFDPTKPRVSMIVIGGTISSKVDYKTGGVSALLDSEELLGQIPELKNIVNIHRVVVPFTRMGESVNYEDWQEIAKEVEKCLKDGDAGVIITQGTDSLHYTAAALSFMLPKIGKPVVIVGSQKSSDRGSSDGPMNLICAAHLVSQAKHLEVRGVGTCLHGSINDSYCLFILGTKVRKMHTSRRDAFRPVNSKPIAKIFPSGKIEVYQKDNFEFGVRADVKYEPKVALVKFTPGADPDIINYYVKKGYKGIVIEALGMGQVSVENWVRNKKDAWVPVIKKAIAKNVIVCFAPQTIYGRVNPNVYSEARQARDVGVVYLEDMLPETALVKLGWVLAHAKNLEESKKMMITNLEGEITERTEIDTFLV